MQRVVCTAEEPVGGVALGPAAPGDGKDSNAAG